LSYAPELACRAEAAVETDMPAYALQASARQPCSRCAASEGWSG
jgi:hypothetical protein